MSYPSGFESRPYYPDIAVYDRSNTRYTHYFRHEVLGGGDGGTGAQLIKPRTYDIRRGINSDSGVCEIMLQDHDNELVERDTGRCKIKTGTELFFYFGRNNPGIMDDRKPWFSGEILETTVARPSYNQQYVKVTSLGLMNRLAHIHISVEFNQGSSTDPDARVSELVKKIVGQADLRVAGSDPGIGTNGVEDSTARIPRLSRNFQTIGLVLSELANISDSVYGLQQTISQTPQLFFFKRGSKRSNFLITNDVVNPVSYTHLTLPTICSV